MMDDMRVMAVPSDANALSPAGTGFSRVPKVSEMAGGTSREGGDTAGDAAQKPSTLSVSASVPHSLGR